MSEAAKCHSVIRADTSPPPLLALISPVALRPVSSAPLAPVELVEPLVAPTVLEGEELASPEVLELIVEPGLPDEVPAP